MRRGRVFRRCGFESTAIDVRGSAGAEGGIVFGIVGWRGWISERRERQQKRCSCESEVVRECWVDGREGCVGEGAVESA